MTGKFGCVQIAAYPGYSCPLFPLPFRGVFTGPNLVAPYIQEWTFSIQHQLTSNTMIEAAYAGKIGTKIEALRTYNPAKFENDPTTGLPPSEGNVNNRTIYEPGYSRSARISARKRFSKLVPQFAGSGNQAFQPWAVCRRILYACEVDR